MYPVFLLKNRIVTIEYDSGGGLKKCFLPSLHPSSLHVAIHNRSYGVAGTLGGAAGVQHKVEQSSSSDIRGEKERTG